MRFADLAYFRLCCVRIGAPGSGSCYFSRLPAAELPVSAQQYKWLFSLTFLADEARLSLSILITDRPNFWSFPISDAT